MSEERITLMQIFQLLKDHFKNYTNISDTQIDKFIQRRNKGVRESRNSKCNSYPTCSNFFQFIDRATSPIIFENGMDETFLQKSCSDVESTSNVPVLLEFQHKINEDDSLMLSFIRENADMKIKMQEINQHLKSISKSIEDNEDGNLSLSRIDRILSKVIRTHKRSEILCDKLCEGLENLESTKPINTLPSELKDFCNRIKQCVGQEYRHLGSGLGLEPNVLDRIEDDYSEADECLETIILEWCRGQETPSMDELVTACHTVNPDILKCKPLPRSLRKVLQKHYNFFYEEMHEIAVLPHLVSSGILTFKLQRYILKPKTKDQRLSRLIEALGTRDNGLDELITALEKSEQPHVSSVLKDSVTDLSLNADPIDGMEFREEKQEPFRPVSMLNSFLGRRHNSFSNELEFDDGRSCISEISFASGSSNLEPRAILDQIAELLLKAGLKLSK
ncbi:uncharacterized protein LOC127715094 isoform X2 [Mytilus californianus]|uniref:uncharacterized protein LOC127715094 isoform X2 n=1 Tax=Mytilus californianus TaxID=6549 RepID=UPI002244FD05|nr:uncharacterized protein LOC127715094 isoform X2 [Mytilus californianus]